MESDDDRRVTASIEVKDGYADINMHIPTDALVSWERFVVVVNRIYSEFMRHAGNKEQKH